MKVELGSPHSPDFDSSLFAAADALIQSPNIIPQDLTDLFTSIPLVQQYPRRKWIELGNRTTEVENSMDSIEDKVCEVLASFAFPDTPSMYWNPDTLVDEAFAREENGSSSGETMMKAMNSFLNYSADIYTQFYHSKRIFDAALSHTGLNIAARFFKKTPSGADKVGWPMYIAYFAVLEELYVGAHTEAGFFITDMKGTDIGILDNVRIIVDLNDPEDLEAVHLQQLLGGNSVSAINRRPDGSRPFFLMDGVGEVS